MGRRLTSNGSGEDGDAGAVGLLERNGFSASQRAAVRDRTRKQLERSKVFLSLIEG